MSLRRIGAALLAAALARARRRPGVCKALLWARHRPVRTLFVVVPLTVWSVAQINFPGWLGLILAQVLKLGVYGVLALLVVVADRLSYEFPGGTWWSEASDSPVEGFVSTGPEKHGDQPAGGLRGAS